MYCVLSRRILCIESSVHITVRPCFGVCCECVLCCFLSVMSADLDLSPPEVPEPTFFESLLRYGLFLGGIFQLICILSIIIPTSKSHEQVRITYRYLACLLSVKVFSKGPQIESDLFETSILEFVYLKIFISGYGDDGFLWHACYCTIGENIG